MSNYRVNTKGKPRSIHAQNQDIFHIARFYNMAKNLENENVFYLWIGKLFELDPALTIKYMLFNKDKFSRKSLDIYNSLLSPYSKERFSL